MNKKKLIKQINKLIKKFPTRQELITSLFNKGANKYICWVIDLIILGKDFDAIQKTLLFTDENFDKVLNDIDIFISF